MIEMKNEGTLDDHLYEWSLQVTGAEAYVTTDSSGNYTIPDLLPGPHVIREEVPPGWAQTYPAAGGHYVDLAPGQSATAADFGNVRGDGIFGHVFHDRNVNGRKDPGDPGMTGSRSTSTWTTTARTIRPPLRTFA
jgi:hypothetical protein